MLNAQTALGYVERIETIRALAEDSEAVVLNELREQPDYEANQDKDLLEAIRLRAEGRDALREADTLIGSFDWVYDEALGENRRKSSLQSV